MNERNSLRLTPPLLGLDIHGTHLPPLRGIHLHRFQQKQSHYSHSIGLQLKRRARRNRPSLVACENEVNNLEFNLLSLS
jgi:hypothetical protein